MARTPEVSYDRMVVPVAMDSIPRADLHGYPLITFFFAVVAMLVATAFSHPLFGQVDSSALGKRENIGEGVNSPEVEIAPVISADGTILYFDRKWWFENEGGGNDPDDIWYSRRLPDGSWGEAVNAGAPLNTTGSDVLFWLSPDGNTALVYNGRIIDGKEMGLAIAKRVNGKWSAPEKISIEGVDQLGSYFYAHLSTDGHRLFLAYSADKGTDNLDIYYVPLLSPDLKRWGRPVRLGSDINTMTSEGSPFLAPDGRTLYFISSRGGGFGSSDIYVTRRTGDGWLEWSPPENLGPEVNTNLFEAGVTLDAKGEYLYTSSVGGTPNYGKTDIFRQKIPAAARPEQRIILVGSVLDAANGQGVQAFISLIEVKSGKEIERTISDSAGEFGFVLDAATRYRIIAEASGYEKGTTELATSRNGGSVDSLALRLKPIGAVTPPLVQFDFASSDLSSAAKAKLDRFVEELLPLQSANRMQRVVLTGHTDSIGTEGDNLNLSRWRAESVRRYLMELGLAPERVTTQGEGELRPVADNGAEKGRARNRRVEIFVERKE